MPDSNSKSTGGFPRWLSVTLTVIAAIFVMKFVFGFAFTLVKWGLIAVVIVAAVGAVSKALGGPSDRGSSDS